MTRALNKNKKWSHIDSLLHQITKEYPEEQYHYYEMLLDWLTVAYFKPEEHLPILVLFGSNRAVGRTSFIKLLGHIFYNNYMVGTKALLDNLDIYLENIRLLCIDECSVGDDRLFGQRIKGFTTSEHPKNFVICTQDVEKGLFVPADEIRYWMIRLTPCKEYSPDLDEQIKIEYPAFLYFLQERMMNGGMYVAQKEHCRWFSPKRIFNDELANLMAGTSSYSYAFENILSMIPGKESLSYKDVKICLRHLANQIPDSDKPCEEYTLNCSPHGNFRDISMQVKIQDLKIHLQVFNFVSDKD